MTPGDAIRRAGRAQPTRSGIRQLAGELDPALLPTAVAKATDDLHAQTNLALAAAVTGTALPDDALTALAPDVLRWEPLALLLGANPEARPAMLDALIAAPWVPLDHRACAVALRLHDTDPATVPLARAELRQMLRAELPSLWHDELILATARRIREQDPFVALLYERATAKMPELHPEAIALPSRFASDIDAADLETLPEHIERAASNDAPKVGRNDSCPCGSKKKFKKCCGRPGAAPQDAPDDERRLRPDLHLSADELSALPAPLLARLPFDELAPPALRAATVALSLARHTPGLGRAIEAWVRRGADDDDHDAVLADGLIVLASHPDMPGPRDLGSLVAALRAPDQRAAVEALLAASAPAGGSDWNTLDALLRSALHEPPGHTLDAAAILLATHPAIATFLLRGLALDAHPADGNTAAGYVAFARDLIGAHPDDPLPAVLRLLDRDDAHADARAAKAAEEERARAALEEKLAELRAAMRRTRAANEQLEADLEAEREALTKLEAADADEGTPAVDPGELRRLRTKVRELKGRIEEGKHERSALRDRLDEAERTAPESRPKTQDAETDEPTEDEPLEPTRLRVPEWSARARKSLSALPASIAQQAVVLAAQLAVGDPLARRGAKKLEGFENLRRARVGIHYRLLYVLHDDTLEVVDVLARENLDSHLGRFRKTIG